MNAKFIICPFDTNLNGVKLNRATIDNWLYTLVSQPVVGKIAVQDSGSADFTSHNMNKVMRTDEYENPYESYEFDTSACGVFTSAQIETIRGKEYITANAKIWKRYPEFCSVIKKRLLNGTLNTSWEIATIKSHIELIGGKEIKVIDEGRFLGHCLLSKYVPSAYPESQLLEVAQKQIVENSDEDLFDALNKDLSNVVTESGNKLETEVQVLDDNKDLNGSVQASLESGTGSTEENNTDVAMLTEFDLRQALREAIAAKINQKKWDFHIIYHFPADGVVWIQLWDSPSELDIITFTYTVLNDVVTVSEPVNGKLSVSVAQINDTVASYEKKEKELSASLVQANATIQTLTTEISSLKPYKEKFEQAEIEKAELERAEQCNELKNYALSSKLILENELAENEDIKNAIDQLDKEKINSIIAERFMEKQLQSNSDVSIETSAANKPSPSTATKQESIKANLDNDDAIPDYKRFMKSFIGRN